MTPAVRDADPADLDAIVEVFLKCWQESYAAVLPAELISMMDQSRAVALWTRVLAASGKVLVAVRAGSGDSRKTEDVLGVTRFAAGLSGIGHVHSLYVSPDAQGLGIGSNLLTQAVSGLVDAGCASAQLWVFQENAPSLRFYRAQGWEPDGTERIQPQFGQRELRLSRPLAPASGTADRRGR